jgi:hypothetical protein
VEKKNFANSKNIEKNICPFQNIELYLKMPVAAATIMKECVLY